MCHCLLLLEAEEVLLLCRYRLLFGALAGLPVPLGGAGAVPFAAFGGAGLLAFPVPLGLAGAVPLAALGGGGGAAAVLFKAT